MLGGNEILTPPEYLTYSKLIIIMHKNTIFTSLIGWNGGGGLSKKISKKI